MARIGVSRYHQPARLVDDPVGGQHVYGGTYLSGTFVQLVGWDVETEQDVFQLSNSDVGGEDAQDVEAERCCQLESRQDKDLCQQPPILVQSALLIGVKAFSLFQQRQILDSLPHRRIAHHRVVVGEGDDIQPSALRLLQDIQIRNVGLSVVGRPGCVQVKVDAVPLSPAPSCVTFSDHWSSTPVVGDG